MLGFITKQVTALVSEATDLVVATSDYIIEDIKSIPTSIEEGWDEGLIDHTPTEPTPKVEPEKRTFGATA